jgi:uncharacterized protein YprB with RNaseH-like and TPR domain
VIFRPGLKERLGELARRRRAGIRPGDGEEVDAIGAGGLDGSRVAAAAAGPRPAPGHLWSDSPVGVEEFLPGGEWRDEGGAVFVHERLRSAIERPRPQWGRLGDPPEDEEELADLTALGLESALFLDLETGGLASSPVFLAGTMHWNGTDFVLRQYFARHYGEEGTLLRALDAATRGFEFLVSFNGKSYDLPFLAGRAVIHAVSLRLPPRHLDLLHPSRRRWKGRLSDCRLQTLEMHVCRRRRAGDVPSDEVPALYHDYVRYGDPYRLIPVFHHNMLDVITMVEILRVLCSPGHLTAPTAARSGTRLPGRLFWPEGDL